VGDTRAAGVGARTSYAWPAAWVSVRSSSAATFPAAVRKLGCRTAGGVPICSSGACAAHAQRLGALCGGPNTDRYRLHIAQAAGLVRCPRPIRALVVERSRPSIAGPGSPAAREGTRSSARLAMACGDPADRELRPDAWCSVAVNMAGSGIEATRSISESGAKAVGSHSHRRDDDS